MDKLQTQQFKREVEDYLDTIDTTELDVEFLDNVYNLFKHLQKQLLIHRPSKPLEFLISKLQMKEAQKIIIVGPPSDLTKRLVSKLHKALGTEKLALGDFMKKLADSGGETAKKIQASQKVMRMVDDDVVIRAVKEQIPLQKMESTSFLIEGYPKTRLQALYMKKLGIVPNSFLILDVEYETCLSYLREKLSAQNGDLGDEEIEQLAQTSLEEYKIHIAGVKAELEGFYIEEKLNEDNFDFVVDDLSRILKIKQTNPR